MSIDHRLDGHIATITNMQHVRDLPHAAGRATIHADRHRFSAYQPIVAAIHGSCGAGGFEMLGATDIRVAAPARRPDLRGRGRERGAPRRRAR